MPRHLIIDAQKTQLGASKQQEQQSLFYIAARLKCLVTGFVTRRSLFNRQYLAGVTMTDLRQGGVKSQMPRHLISDAHESINEIFRKNFQVNDGKNILPNNLNRRLRPNGRRQRVGVGHIGRTIKFCIRRHCGVLSSRLRRGLNFRTRSFFAVS